MQKLKNILLMMFVILDDVCYCESSNIAQKDLEGNEGNYPIFGASGLIKNVDFYKQDKEYIAVVKDGAGIGKVFILPKNSSIIGTLQYILPKDNTDIKYLYYAMVFMNLSKYFSGSTIPHIYFKTYKKEKINLPTIDIQVKRASILSKIDEIINKYEQLIEKHEILIKSRFVPGSDKYGSGLKKLSDCCEINPSKNKDMRLYDELLVSFIPMSSISNTGAISTSEVKLYREVKNGFTYFTEGDVLFAKITPCMENGKGAIAKGLCNGIGFGSTEFHVLRPKFKESNSFWLYVLTSFDAFRVAAASHMTGSAGQRRVPSSFLENFKTSIPPVSLQDKFENIVKQIDKSKFIDLEYPINQDLEVA